MGMLGYFDVFPAKRETELRTARFENCESGSWEARGIFLFTEFFCTDPKCNCQQVLIKVLCAVSDGVAIDEVATISACWGSSDDDSFIWQKLKSNFPDPFLDPMHPQASYADEVLDFWNSMIERDDLYAARIKRHYDEIRAEVGQPVETWTPPHSPQDVERGVSDCRLLKRQRRERKKRQARSRQRK